MHDKLADLKQTKSVREYTTKFRSVVLEIPRITEDEKLDRFIRGLQDKERIEVEMRELKTLEGAIRIADRYNLISNGHNGKQHKSVATLRPVYTGPVPIELDTKRYQRLTNKEYEILKAIYRYFYY